MAEPVTVPIGVNEIRADFDGFEALAVLQAGISQFEGEKIAIDCRKLSWFDAHLGAALMTIIKQSRLKFNEISLFQLPPHIRLILQKNGTLAQRATDNFHTTIPVSSFELNQEVEFAQFSRNHLLRKEMPKMSIPVRSKFFEGIDELFANSALHSKSAVPVLAAGQFFPRTDRLAFTLSDGGRGIGGSLLSAGVEFEFNHEAIDWAMQSNNTSRTGDIPGGLGLNLLKEFIMKNGGRLMVCSFDGFWELTGDRVKKATLRREFPGTVVIMEVNTADRHAYRLGSSINPNDIW